MKFDANNLIIMEQTPVPGRYGDSCAETSRYITLCQVLKKLAVNNTFMFITNQGVVRYPGGVWLASDTSSDQVAPLLSALPYVCQDQVLEQLKQSGYRTGNGNLVTLGLLAQMKRAEGSKIQALYDLAFIGQALLFMLPWRWNDATKSLTSSQGSTADYLNFINAAAYSKIKRPTLISRFATKLVKQNTAMAAVISYYKPEPNSQWLLDIYAEAIPKIWSA